MPKVFSLTGILLLVLAGFDADESAYAQALPLKFKAVPACSALENAAATNHIPVTGFDPPPATNVMHAGDSVTILGTIFIKKKEAQWLLYVEAGAPGTNSSNRPMVVHMFNRKMSFPSKPVPATLRMLGPFAVSNSAKLKSRDQSDKFNLNETFLGLGLQRAAEVMWKHNQQTNSAAPPRRRMEDMKLTPQEQEAVAGSIPALMSYFDIVQNTDGLENLLMKLIKLPSVWSMVRHLGVTAVLYSENDARPANPADWDLPPHAAVYYLPFTLLLNGQPSVKITFVVTAPNPPRLVCGGVVGLLAERVGDNDTYMTMRVISAKCKPSK